MKQYQINKSFIGHFATLGYTLMLINDNALCKILHSQYGFIPTKKEGVTD